jgi:hypothetical protein
MAKPNRFVVSIETSAPSKKRQNRKLPDVCQTFKIACYQPYEVNRALGFKTNWKKHNSSETPYGGSGLLPA